MLPPELREEIQAEHDKFMLGRAEAMQKAAEDNKEYQSRCVMGEKVYISEDETARLPGHIYSLEGMKEYHISRLCEFHFDEITKEPEDAGGSDS